MYRLCLIAFAAATLSAQKAPSTQDQILDQLKQLTKLFQEFVDLAKEPDPPARPQAPPAVHAKVDVGDAPALGLTDAPVTIVEFTDFQCPFCNKFHTDTFPKLHDDYITTGKIRWVHRDLPLPATMHPNALQAAEAGRCAREQGHFWEFRDWMQSNPTRLSIEELRDHASELELDLNQYRECMATGKYRAAVNADAKEAQDLNITGTPAFLIGKSGSTIDGDVIMGAQPYDVFASKLEALLKLAR